MVQRLFDGTNLSLEFSCQTESLDGSQISGVIMKKLVLEVEQGPSSLVFWGYSEQMHECGDLYWDSNVRFT